MSTVNKGSGVWKTAIWAILAMAAVVALILFSGGQGADATGVLMPQVFDGDTDQPVEGCTVVIPELGVCAVTDAEGKTPALTLSAKAEESENDMPVKEWNEVTVLVYKQGYIPYALFHVQVWKDVTREGPRIYIFADDGTTDGRPFSIIEGPDRGWVEDVVEKYRPAE